MAIYHIHLINAHVEADDLQGHELPSLEAARVFAIDGIRGFLGDELTRGILDLRGRVDIEDADGAVLMSIPFHEAVTIRFP